METNRCSLHEIKQSDKADMIRLYQNKEVRNFLGGIRTEESIDKTLDEMLHSADDTWYWIIRNKRSNEFMGLVSLDTHHNGEDTEVSYQFLPKWWGSGYATEVIKNVIINAFKISGITRIVAETQTENIRS